MVIYLVLYLHVKRRTGCHIESVKTFLWVCFLLISYKSDSLEVLSFIRIITRHLSALVSENSDGNSSQKWYSRLFAGQKIDCRILKVNLLKKRIILTRKPSLLNSKDRIINKYSLDDIGLITTGYISSILSSGGILVNFYGDVRALMLSKEAARLSSSVKFFFLMFP